MSNIRVTYSGLIAFIVALIGVFFGLFFSLIVTRTLSAEEFGTWGLIFSIVNYFLITELVVSFWSTRLTARGENIGRSSIVSSFILSLITIPIFFAYVFLVSQNSNTNFEILFLGAILIPLYFVSHTLSGINIGHKPQAVSYGNLIFLIVKIPIAFYTIIILDMGVFGVILAFFFALIVKITVQSYFALPKIRSKLNYEIIKWWIKYSWIPLFTRLQNYIRLFDVVLYSIIVGSVLGVAYYNVALTIATVVGYSVFVSHALYPKILSNNKFEGIKKNIDMFLFFGIPLLGIAIIFAKPAVYALNPIYLESWPIVILLSFRVFFKSLQNIPTSIITGTEQIDTQQNPKFSQLIKSNLFYVPKISLIFSGSYIIILTITLFLLKPSVQNEFDLVLFWAILGIAFEIPFITYLWVRSRKFGKFSFPLKNVIKYIIATLVVMTFFIFSSEYIIIYENNIYKFLPSLILELGLCIGIYLGMTYLISSDTRILVKSVLKELKKRNNF